MGPDDAGRLARWLKLTTLVGITLAAGSVSAALALLRLAEPGGRHAIEAVAFTPVGLPAALVGLVGALALLRWRPRLGRTVLVFAVGLTAVHAWWLGPRFVGALPDADPAGTRLVVMTQNFEQGDAHVLASLVREHAVDVLVLTDAAPDQVQAVAAARVGDALTYSTLDLPGTVVWSRYPITSDTLISDGGDSRVVTLDVPGLQAVTVVALHPTPPYQAGGSRWQADWERVLNRMRETYGNAAQSRVLVVGDLNATADHWPMRSLANLGFRDAAEQLNTGLAATWPANGMLTRLGVTIPALLALDHVLTAPGLVATDLVVTGDAGSDHRAVIATITGVR